jgi:hypothetical protein
MIKAPFKIYLETCETMMGRIITQKLVANLKSPPLGTLQQAMMIVKLIKKL